MNSEIIISYDEAGHLLFALYLLASTAIAALVYAWLLKNQVGRAGIGRFDFNPATWFMAIVIFLPLSLPLFLKMRPVLRERGILAPRPVAHLAPRLLLAIGCMILIVATVTIAAVPDLPECDALNIDVELADMVDRSSDEDTALILSGVRQRYLDINHWRRVCDLRVYYYDRKRDNFFMGEIAATAFIRHDSPKGGYRLNIDMEVPRVPGKVTQ